MHYPTQQLKNAYGSALATYERDINTWGRSSVGRQFGRFQIYLEGDRDKMRVDLEHYDTWILSLFVDRRDGSVTIEHYGGWSNTDRDNMNGLLNILGQPSAFYIRDYVLRCDFDNVVHPSGIVWGPVFRSQGAEA